MNKKLAFLIIHCTATPQGREVGSAQIRNWHTLAPPYGRGWKQVGYTDLVHLDGSIERLVPNNEDGVVDAWEITNGVAGLNTVSRHIAYVGGLSATGERAQDTRTPAQCKALAQYVLDMLGRHPGIEVAGHNEFAGKDCPSFDVRKWVQSLIH